MIKEENKEGKKVLPFVILSVPLTNFLSLEFRGSGTQGVVGYQTVCLVASVYLLSGIHLS